MNFSSILLISHGNSFCKNMRRACRGHSRLGWITLLIGLALVPAGCRRNVAGVTPPPAPPPNYLAIGDAAYAARNYPGAAEAYQTYLKVNGQAPDADRALFRTAMAYYLKDSPLYDSARALEILRQLATTHAASPYAAEANLYLTLNEELSAGHQALAERSRRIEELEIEIAALKIEDQKKAEELAKLKADTAKREERIRQVSAELERLKAIDMQRRPTKPVR